MIRCKPSPNNDLDVPWFWKGKPCRVVGLGIEDMTVQEIYVEVDGMVGEIVCGLDDNGKFENLLYGMHS